MSNASEVNPIHILIAVGILGVILARYGPNFSMPMWIESTLRWGGWALIAFGVASLLGLMKLLDAIPLGALPI